MVALRSLTYQVEREAGSGDLLVRGSRIVAQGDVVLGARDSWPFCEPSHDSPY